MKCHGLDDAAAALVSALLLYSSGAGAQTTVIAGRVTSEFGAPLGTASVVVADLNLSALAGADGRYSITIPPARMLNQKVVVRARAIGYAPQSATVQLSAGSLLQNFVLRRDVNHLEDVVVTGTVTGTAVKNLPFVVARLDSATMPVPSVNPIQQLQGKIPGVQVVQPTGRPGAAPAILLRGPKSINATGRSQEPLLIVDGAVINRGLQEINSEDIESIEVVKGAAASSLYGSRAGAGVIQIRTKSGRSGRPGSRFNFRSEVGFRDVQGRYQNARRHFLMMDERNERFCIQVPGQPQCSRVVDLYEEARRINDTATAAALTPYSFERDYGIGRSPSSQREVKGLFQVNRWPTEYDPLSQVVTSGLNMTNSLDARGQSGPTSYYASISNLVEEGAFRYLKGYRRTSGRLNLEHTFSDQLQASLSSTYAISTQYPAVSGGPDYVEIDDFFRLTRVPAFVNLLQRDRYGRLYIRPSPLMSSGQNTNPLYDFENSEGHNEVDRFLSSLQVRYSPVAWLTLDATGSTDRRNSSSEVFRDKGYRVSFAQFWRDGIINRVSDEDESYNTALGAKAEFDIGADWHGAATARWSYERQAFNRFEGDGEQLAVPGVRTLDNAIVQSTHSSSALVSAIGAFSGVQLDYRGRYIIDGLLRFDGSSLFGADERWHPYYRTSFAWRISDEKFWPLKRAFNDFKLRASRGTAGGRPNFTAQYETYSVSLGGQVEPLTLGNKQLKPERTKETELGIDAEMFSRVGISVTYARDITDDQILVVPTEAASGFSNQWKNAGSLDGNTWEASLRIPIIQRRSFTWTSQLNWDRTRTTIIRLNVDPFQLTTGNRNGSVARFLIAPGVKMGTIYGRRFVTRCSELPAPYDSQCGSGQEFQKNDEGYVVWVGSGHTPAEGVTLNLWQTSRPGCIRNGVAIDAASAVICSQAGGSVTNPWGVPVIHWGMPLMMRDSGSAPLLLPLGNTLPKYRVSMAHSVELNRWKLYGLADASVGNRVFNSERHWSYGDFMTREQDQTGKTVETAKPIGYHWRIGRPENVIGVGGFYNINEASNRTVEDGSYVKLREISASYTLGKLAGVGDWTLSLVGRNLYTWTRYLGWDPEVGIAGGGVNSAAIVAAGMFQYPPTRAFTLVIASRF